MHPSPSLGKPLPGGVGRDRGCPRNPRVPIKCWWPVWGQSHSGMAEPGPEPGRAWRLLALCGAAVFLAAAAAGGALVAWNLAASTARGTRCPESEQVNATVWPPDSAPEIEELRRRLVEAEQRRGRQAGAGGGAQGLQGPPGRGRGKPERSAKRFACLSLGPRCSPTFQRVERKCRTISVSPVF